MAVSISLGLSIPCGFMCRSKVGFTCCIWDVNCLRSLYATVYGGTTHDRLTLRFVVVEAAGGGIATRMEASGNVVMLIPTPT